jgi:hypothetical protein
MSALLYLLAMVASTAAVEYCVLRRWFGRRSLTFCVLGAALFSGIFWAAVLFTRTSILYGWKDAGYTLTFMDFATCGFFFMIWTVGLTVIALIPATLTAAVYLRLKS